MSTTINTWLTYAKIGGNDAYVLNGDTPAGVQSVFGATFIKSSNRWVFPAFRPVHRRVCSDLEAVCAREKRSFALHPSARAHMLAMDTYEPLPEDFKFITTPYQHQLQGLLWLYNHPRAGLFFDPGLGKCKITVDLYRTDEVPTLILCPSVVLRTWAREFVTHGNIHDVMVLEGTAKRKKDMLEEAIRRPPAALVCTYESAMALIQRLPDLAYGRIVLDESHRAKEPTSKRTKSTDMLAQRRPKRVILSGTPTLGSPFSVYPQLRILGSYFMPEPWGKFKDTYAVRAAHNEHQVVGFRKMEDLNKRVNMLCMRRKQEECLDLPERQIIDVPFELSREQKNAYNEVVEFSGDPKGRAEAFAADRNLLTVNDGALRPVPYVYGRETVVKLGKLEQIVGGFVNESRANLGICNGCPRLETCIEDGIRAYTPACAVVKKSPVSPRLLADNARAEACRDLLEDILANPENKVIIWTRYLPELDIVKELARSLGVDFVSVQGGMATDAFEKAMHTFNTVPSCRLYIGQVASGIGVTLNAANYMIYYSLPWSHEHYNQSRARNYRIGQTKRVVIYRLLANGSTDLFKADALDQKIEIEDMLTNADYAPACPIHSYGARPNGASEQGCRCDGSIDKIVAAIQLIQ